MDNVFAFDGWSVEFFESLCIVAECIFCRRDTEYADGDRNNCYELNQGNLLPYTAVPRPSSTKISAYELDMNKLGTPFWFNYYILVWNYETEIGLH